MKVDYTCKNEECEHDFEIDFSPATPDRFMSGRFEDAEPGTSAECCPCECPECGKEVDVEEVEQEIGE